MKMGPDAWEPSPYEIWNVPLCSLLVEDDDGSYECFAWQPLHDDDGTHKSDEPVSKSIVKLCAGVPMDTVPVHSSLLS